MSDTATYRIVSRPDKDVWGNPCTVLLVQKRGRFWWTTIASTSSFRFAETMIKDLATNATYNAQGERIE